MRPLGHPSSAVQFPDKLGPYVICVLILLQFFINQCEHLLTNSIGKAILGSGINPLTFSPKEQMQIVFAMLTAVEEKLRSAAERVCQWLDLKDENARLYVQTVIPQLSMWIGDNVRSGNVDTLFL